MVDPQLMTILVCPETRTPLHAADDAVIARLNREVTQGRLKNRSGRVVAGPIEGGLVREDGKYLFPVIDSIPVMLIDESIPLEGRDRSHE